jgi:hypothetical protein
MFQPRLLSIFSRTAAERQPSKNRQDEICRRPSCESRILDNFYELLRYAT